MTQDDHSIPNLVSLRTAVLCANCEVISEGYNGRCAACGGESLLRLKGILGETIQGEMPVTLARPTLVEEDLVELALLAAA